MRSLVTVTAAALLLAGCSGGSDDSAAKATQEPAQVATAESVPGQVSAPTPAQRTALLKALAKIDPALSRDREQAMANATKTCAELLNPKDKTGRKLRESARLRFAGAGAELDAAQTMKLLTAVRDTICPDAAWP